MRRQKEIFFLCLHVYMSTLNQLSKETPMIDQSHIDLLGLIEKIPNTKLRRNAGTDGGEWHGACPLPDCKGGDDRFHVWPKPNQGNPRWWCRGCGGQGDAIAFVQAYHSLSFIEALTFLELDMSSPATTQLRPAQAPVAIEPPPTAWQSRALTFVIECQNTLWSAMGKLGLDALHQRGFNDATLCLAHLGYNPYDQYVPRSAFGLPPDWDAFGNPKDIWLPHGVVIPWFVDGQLWKVSIRRPSGEPRYYFLPGSVDTLYNADTLHYSKPAILCEGPFDALAIQQATKGLISAIASGTTGARKMRWITRLALAQPLLLAFDTDEPGLKAAMYWQEIFPEARIWRPFYDDPAAMLETGADVRAWAFAGVGWGREGFSVDGVQTAGRELWRLWDDGTNQVIGEFHSAAEAEQAVAA